MKWIIRSTSTFTRCFRLRRHVSMCAQFRVADDDSAAVDATVLRPHFAVTAFVLQHSEFFEL